jgi:hypothetical protein
MSPPLAYARGTVPVSQGAAPVEKFGAKLLTTCLFLQNIFTLSTPTLTYPASQHISKAICHHKLPNFSAGENISAPHQIKLSSSNSYWSLSSVKQPGELPGDVR